MYQNQPPLQGMANEMAGYGRYGDSMLVHMNPMEVQGIAALSPTGELTTNPVTGQPEAFLPFLAPLLGSFLGSSFLAGSTLGGLLGTGLSSAAAGAIGSGLATTAATGDIKKGLLSGITGFGLGKALGAASDTLNPQIGDTATALGDATTAATDAGVELAKATADAVDPVSQAIKGTVDPITNQSITQAASPIGAPVTDPITGATMSPVVNNLQRAAAGPMDAVTSAQNLKAVADAKVGRLSDQLTGLRDAQTSTDRLTAAFKEPGAFGKALIQPMNLAAIGVGEGQVAAMTAQEEFEKDAKRFEREKEEEYERGLANIDLAYDELERGYPGYTIPRYAASGGVTSINPQHFAQSMAGLHDLAGDPIRMYPGGGVPSGVYRGAQNAGAATRQAGIRGSDVISPQELQGYRPGFDAEIEYFRKPPPTTTQPGTGGDQGTPAPTPGGPGDYSEYYDAILGGLGGFDLNAFLQTQAGDETVGSIQDVLGIPDYENIQSRLDEIEASQQSEPAEAIDYEEIANRVRGDFDFSGVDFSNLEERLSGLEGSPQQGFDDTALQERLAALENMETPAVDLSGIQAQIDANTQRFGEIPQVDLSGIESRLSGLEETPGFDASALQSQIDANRESLGNIPAFDDTALRGRLEALESAPGFDASGLEGLISANTQAISNIPVLTPDQLADIQSRGVVTPQVDPMQAMQDKLGATPARGPRPSKTPPPKRPPPKRPPRGRGRPGMAEGRETDAFIEETAMTDTLESNGQLLIDRAVMAISGQLPEEQAAAVVAAFIDEFGPEAYQMLREKVLEEIVPGSQKEGEIKGQGGGMDDMVPGMIGDSQPVAVSPGEYIVPADVVSGLGDGSTDAGVNQLDQMLDRVREERTGTVRQPAPMRLGGVLPA